MTDILTTLLDIGGHEERLKIARLMEELFIFIPERDSYKPRYQEVGAETIRRIMERE